MFTQRLVYFILALAFLSPAFANPLLELQSKIKTQKKVTGLFEQIKEIKSMDLKLNSSGSFELKDNTLYWIQLKPLRQITKISSEGLFVKEGDSAFKEVKGPNSASMKSISKLILCSFNANEACLKNNFTISDIVGTAQTRWSLKLMPKGGLVKKALSNLALSGDSKFIKQIIISDSTGSQTKILFKKIKAQ